MIPSRITIFQLKPQNQYLAIFNHEFEKLNKKKKTLMPNYIHRDILDIIYTGQGEIIDINIIIVHILKQLNLYKDFKQSMNLKPNTFEYLNNGDIVRFLIVREYDNYYHRVVYQPPHDNDQLIYQMAYPNYIDTAFEIFYQEKKFNKK